MGFRNWSGSVACKPMIVVHPESVADVVVVVRNCAYRRGSLRVVGAGHSFTPLCATSDTLMSLDALAGLVSVDRERLRVRVRAGTRLHALNRLLAAQGLALANLGDIDRQSIAGALATGTHGTGLTLGNLSTQVTGMTLVTGTGEVVTCSAEQEPETFRAARVSLGALGVVVEVELSVRPAYRLRCQKSRASLADCLGRLPELNASHRHCEFFWMPYTDAVQLELTDETDEPATSRIAARAGDLLLENLAFGALCNACGLFPGLAEGACRLSAALIGDSRRVAASHHVFATPRHVRFQEMEYALPLAAAAAVLDELRVWISRHRPPVCFPVEVRFGAGDDADLSPAHGRDTAYVAVHNHRSLPHAEYFAAAEAIFGAHDGRPHWGKMHGLTAAELAPLYPRWSAFAQVRERLDAGGVFLTPYLRGLLSP